MDDVLLKQTHASHCYGRHFLGEKNTHLTLKEKTKLTIYTCWLYSMGNNVNQIMLVKETDVFWVRVVFVNAFNISA